MLTLNRLCEQWIKHRKGVQIFESQQEQYPPAEEVESELPNSSQVLGLAKA